MANQNRSVYIVLEWRQDAQYRLTDAVGCRTFRTLRGAEQFRDKMVASWCGHAQTPNLVVRSLPFVSTIGATITAAGRVQLAA